MRLPAVFCICNNIDCKKIIPQVPVFKALRDFVRYSNSTKTNAFCLGIILCNVSRSFDYLIYPYYPAYTS